MTLRDKCVDALFRKFKPAGGSAAGEAQRQAVDIIFAEIAKADDETIKQMFEYNNIESCDWARSLLKRIFGKIS